MQDNPQDTAATEPVVRKKRSAMPWIVGGLVLACLLITGVILVVRAAMNRLGASTTINPVNTLIWLVPAGGSNPTSTETPIAVTPYASQESSTAAATAVVPTAAQPAAAQGCNNPLYPLKAGNSWSYKVTARGNSYLVDMSVPSVSGSQALVNLSNQATHLSSQAAVDCENGAIRNFPWMAASMLFNQTINGSMSAQYVSGLLAPSQPTFANNNWNLTWNGQYTLTGSGTVEFQGNKYALSLNQAPLALNCHTLGSGAAAFEPITVAAGSFPSALKVICSMQTQATLKANGYTVTGNVTGQSTQWFGPGVGLLKMQVDSANIQYLIFTAPLNVSGGLELQRYQVSP
jgi:hypothetical protein